MREPTISYYLKVLDKYRTRALHLSKVAMAKELGISPHTYRAWYRDNNKKRKPSSKYVKWIKSFLESRDIVSADRWMEKEGLQLLCSIGFGERDVVVDFGCGRGDYTLMLARVVGERGKVYSVDKDKGVLSELMGRAYGKGLTNIHGTFVSRDKQPPTELPLPDASIDAFWLSDVLHDGYFKNDEHKKALISEVRRTLKEDGFIAVHPVHMEEKRLKKIIKEAGFHMDREYRRVVLFHGSEFHRASIFRLKIAR